MKTVYFKLNGRFGNNFFQYLASEIIKKIYNFDEVKIYNNESINSNLLKIDDVLFKKIGNEYINGKVYVIDTNKSILLDGYFQRCEIFEYFRCYLVSLFNNENKNFINNKFQVCDIFNHKISHNITPGENDLVVHIRLDDFIGDLQIFQPEEIINIINKISYEKLYIVCDKLRYLWEINYIEKFSHLKPIFISYSMLDDFKFIMSSKKIITSASTFAWLATFLGESNEIHIPYNTFHGGEESDSQNLGTFNDKCIVYKNLKYWDKKLI
jgi:hypothetical protein